MRQLFYCQNNTIPGHPNNVPDMIGLNVSAVLIIRKIISHHKINKLAVFHLIQK